ncbi:MAG: NAD(P)/FAD-dependent oxidoreductase [Chloroflexota bacterium]
MKDYRRTSFWLETAGDLTPRPPLDGSVDVDVAILGAGFSGLWTAYYLQERDPALRIALVEREIAGFGASGRNGGWCTPGFPVSGEVLAERFGLDAAHRLEQAMFDAVDEVGRVIQAEGIDAQYLKRGSLRLARGKHQAPAIDGYHATMNRLGLGHYFQRLDAGETAARVRVTNVVGSLFNHQCAVIHPARLVRGLAQVVERRGATIFEQTGVTSFVPGPNPRLSTARGDVRAKAIVLAGEAWLSQLPGKRRAILPLYSLIVLTEPLSPEEWEQIGWQNRELIASCRYSVDYLQRTADGRIMFGGRGAPYRMNSQITEDLDRHEPTHAMLRDLARQWFPAAKDVRFTHAWGGPLGMPRDWMPTTSWDPRSGVGAVHGYTGQGVATSNLFGRIMADLVTGTASDLTKLPTVNHRSPEWEPEPFRFLGIRYVQEGMMNLDRAAESTGQPPTGKTLVERLGRH